MNDASAMTTSLDEAGRILLPPLVQSQLGIKPGDELALQEVNGQWLLKPAATAADLHDDDLNWEELDYGSIAPSPSRQVTVRIEQRGKLMPMAHAARVGERWRLRSPFLEHFSQAFARSFMRVGLPSSVPEF